MARSIVQTEMINRTVYRELQEAGMDAPQAGAVAAHLPDWSQFAIRQDLASIRQDLAQLETGSLGAWFRSWACPSFCSSWPFSSTTSSSGRRAPNGSAARETVARLDPPPGRAGVAWTGPFGSSGPRRDPPPTALSNNPDFDCNNTFQPQPGSHRQGPPSPCRQE